MITMFRITVDFELSSDVTPERVEEFGRGFLDELYDLDGVVDPDLTASMADGRITVTFELAPKADGPGEASLEAATLIRTALHACGTCTGGMEPVIRDLATRVQSPRASDPIDRPHVPV